ncbi:hypothetical protein [Streptomyces sp. H27-S2]|uniref:hypothetical protein n=1 Tax=Streptomyces antarcticus TaxID=2996458 RepID=UPI0022722D0B|nr:hypothetical protein [Streptomyces sp. H27-S2]MCY0954947.1 hypothetical protein [Streptomyces sp. H27-S2]
MHTLDHARLAIELQALIDEARTLRAEQQAELAPYLTADGDVNEDYLREYGDARITTAIEAADRLDTLLNQLGLLTGPPARLPFTVTIAGRERHDGERPYSFAVYATGLDDALHTLPELPTFQRWLRDVGGPSTEPDVALVAEQCHPGLRAPGECIDLRAEQAARTNTRSSTVPSQPAVPGAAHRPPHRHR